MSRVVKQTKFCITLVLLSKHTMLPGSPAETKRNNTIFYRQKVYRGEAALQLFVWYPHLISTKSTQLVIENINIIHQQTTWIATYIEILKHSMK